jgi:hypothetical protein
VVPGQIGGAGILRAIRNARRVRVSPVFAGYVLPGHPPAVIVLSWIVAVSGIKKASHFKLAK